MCRIMVDPQYSLKYSTMCRSWLSLNTHWSILQCVGHGCPLIPIEVQYNVQDHGCPLILIGVHYNVQAMVVP